LPDTRAGTIAADYLRAFNSGDAATMKRFFEAEVVRDSTRPVAARVETYRKIYDENGPLELTFVENATPTSLTITVSAAKGQNMMLSFEIEEGATGKLKRLAVNVDR